MRLYMMERAAADRPLLLINDKPITWQAPYIIDHEITDLTDPLAVDAAADALAARWPIAGVLTWDEYHLLAAARLAERYGVPGNPPTAVTAARDKATSRQLFDLREVPSARSTWVRSLEAAVAAAERIGYPVVLKPAAHAGSVGVIRMDTDDALPRGWEVASAGASHQGPEGQGVLVEEYLAGPEISVETVTQHGLTTAVAVTHKRLGFAPYFMETGHCVMAGDPLLKTVAPIAEAALRAVGITNGVSHVEMRLTEAGTAPRIIEVNARIGGDLIGHLVRLATGIDLIKAAAAIACGDTPDLTATDHRGAAIGMIYPPHDGILIDQELLPGSDRHLDQFHWLHKIGDPVTLLPSNEWPNTRVGFAVATGTTSEEAQRHLEEITARAVVTVGHTSARGSSTGTSPGRNTLAADGVPH